MARFKSYSPKKDDVDVKDLEKKWELIGSGACDTQLAYGDVAGSAFASKEHLDKYYAIYFLAKKDVGVRYFRLCVHGEEEDRPLQRINVYFEKPEGFLTADVKRIQGYKSVFPVGESTAMEFEVYGLI